MILIIGKQLLNCLCLNPTYKIIVKCKLLKNGYAIFFDSSFIFLIPLINHLIERLRRIHSFSNCSVDKNGFKLILNISDISLLIITYKIKYSSAIIYFYICLPRRKWIVSFLFCFRTGNIDATDMRIITDQLMIK